MEPKSKRKRDPESDGETEREVTNDEADHAPVFRVDFTEDRLGYTPSAGQFLNFVMDKYSLPPDAFIGKPEDEEEDAIYDRLIEDLWATAFDKPVEFMEKEHLSLLHPEESKLFQRYNMLVEELVTLVRTTEHFGDYDRNENNELLLRFKKLRDMGPNEQLVCFFYERLRILELPVKEAAIAGRLDDQRLRLENLKAHLVEKQDELKALYGDFPDDDFVYKDTPIEDRGGFPPIVDDWDPFWYFDWDDFDGFPFRF